MEFEMLIVKPGEDLTEVEKIRKEIFGTGEDDLDEIAINIVLKESGKAAACGRLLLDMESDRLIIEQIGVAEEKRRQGIGTEVMRRLMDIALENETEEVWAKTHSNEAVIELLSKHGFDELNKYWMSVDVPYYRP